MTKPALEYNSATYHLKVSHSTFFPLKKKKSQAYEQLYSSRNFKCGDTAQTADTQIQGAAAGLLEKARDSISESFFLAGKWNFNPRINKLVIFDLQMTTACISCLTIWI